MVSFNDQSVQEKLRAQGIDVALSIAGIHRAKFPLKTKGHSKLHSIEDYFLW